MGVIFKKRRDKYSPRRHGENEKGFRLWAIGCRFSVIGHSGLSGIGCVCITAIVGNADLRSLRLEGRHRGLPLH